MRSRASERGGPNRISRRRRRSRHRRRPGEPESQRDVELRDDEQSPPRRGSMPGARGRRRGVANDTVGGSTSYEATANTITLAHTPTAVVEAGGRRRIHRREGYARCARSHDEAGRGGRRRVEARSRSRARSPSRRARVARTYRGTAGERAGAELPPHPLAQRDGPDARAPRSAAERARARGEHHAEPPVADLRQRLALCGPSHAARKRKPCRR